MEFQDKVLIKVKVEKVKAQNFISHIQCQKLNFMDVVNIKVQ